MDRNKLKMSKSAYTTGDLIRIGAFALLCVLVAPAVLASPLSDAAQALAPGSWVELPTQGLSVSLLEPQEGGSITYYSDNAAWDSTSKTFFFIGAPHYEPARFIQYKESTNTWSTLPINAPIPIHGYHHTTIDVRGRTLYHRFAGTDQVVTYNVDTQQWGQLAPFPTGYVQFAGGLNTFPDWGSSGSLIFAQGGLGEVHRYDIAQSKWTLLRSGLAMGNYHNFAEYNPVKKVVWFGGGDGSRDLYTIDAQGTITTKRQAPIPIGIQDSVTTVDPVSGDYLVFGGPNAFYVYNVTNDTWSQKTGSYPLFNPANNPVVTGVVAAPISNYGVVMFLKYHPDATKVYLYKHAPSSGTPVDTLTPKNPTGLVAQ